ncbi:hypothetical protein GCM10007276_31640 [Agaricicola taiwanensis]|uniref:Uncharacterized protein n=1 Tax=Agaricicola taiwanensis TaxID=591372 RepID=A0A8J2YLQ4_9RHOB|nr:hypothetical protein [Agaricicola taiwanensis]GGE52312.1 hypothetical protein GCM10007276_31640 [Agaricicola taiwanensis]
MTQMTYVLIGGFVWLALTGLIVALLRAGSQADDEMLGDLQYTDDMEKHVDAAEADAEAVSPRSKIAAE